MVISELSIKRPVLATVMNLLLVLLCVICFQRLSVREYPNIDAPVVTVRTVYLGASAAIMESQVSQPLEDQLSGIEGIKVIKSISREEVSLVTVEFHRERDADSAANDVRDRVARTRAQLPVGIREPVVQKIEADAGHHLAGVFQRKPDGARDHRLRRSLCHRQSESTARSRHRNHRW